VGKYFPPFAGGMETYLRDLMVEHTRQGLQCTALVHRSEFSLVSLEEPYDAGGLKLQITRAAVWARLLFTPISPTFPLCLRKLIRRQRPDVLHLHMPNVSVFWLLLLPSARRIPWLIHWHSDVPASSHSLGLRLFYAFYRPLEQAILKRCQAVIATSPPYLDSSQVLAPYREKCTVVPLGLDPGNLAPVGVDATRTEAARLRVLAIGRLTYYKGFEYLVRAAAENPDVDVRIVGDGDLAGYLADLAGKLGGARRVSFTGQLSDSELAREYLACDCFCLPSIERTEAFGLVLLEAMYFSRATIVSDVPGSGMGWIVEDGVTGLKVPVADATALAAAFRQLRADRDNLARLGTGGRRKFDRLFHIQKSASEVARLYAGLTGIKQQGPGGASCQSE
jgi:rhamnosyl/mannosyltransferase